MHFLSFPFPDLPETRETVLSWVPKEILPARYGGDVSEEDDPSIMDNIDVKDNAEEVSRYLNLHQWVTEFRLQRCFHNPGFPLWSLLPPFPAASWPKCSRRWTRIR